METITNFRKQHKLTQSELAELLGTTQSRISHIEKGRRNLTVDLAKTLTNVSEDLGSKLTLDQIYGNK